MNTKDESRAEPHLLPSRRHIVWILSIVVGAAFFMFMEPEEFSKPVDEYSYALFNRIFSSVVYDAENSDTIGVVIAETLPEWKARISTGYAFGEYNVQWTMNYIDGMDVVNSNAGRSRVTAGVVPTVGSYTYHRLTGSWTPGMLEGLSLTAGINNLMDKQPPVYTGDAGAGIQSNTDPSTYDVLGRRYFVSATYKF